jgi:hypothetical protein
VSPREFTLKELTDLLERFRPERAAGKAAPPEITEAQVQLLLARIGAFTDALRGAESNEPARLAMRVALNDLATIAAQFRGRTNTMRAALEPALADLRNARAEVPGAKGC